MTILKLEDLDSVIIEPSPVDYIRLDFQAPPSEIETATSDEIKEYAGMDNSYGIPLMRKGLFVDKQIPLVVPKPEDYKRLGIDPLAFFEGDIVSPSFFIEDGIAYMPRKSLVDCIEEELKVKAQISNAGAVAFTLAYPNFQSPIGCTNVAFFDPAVDEISEKYGSRVRDAQFPKFEGMRQLVAQKESIRTGITSSGLHFVLYS